MTQSSALPSRGHYSSLDGFRGIAVLMVVLVHCRQMFIGNNRLDVGLSKLMYLGTHGVDLFFVLSGFLITGILLDSRQDSGYFSKFYTRRALRIFPAYYLYLAVRLLLLPALAGKFALVRGNFSNPQPHSIWIWLYATNIVRMDLMGGVFHLWSLAVEEQFYLVWPLIVYFTPRRHLWKVCLIVVGAAPLLRILAVQYGVPDMAYGLTPCRMDALALGGLIALMQRDAKSLGFAQRLSAPLLWASAGVIVALYALQHRWPGPGAFTVTLGLEAFAILAACIILRLLTSPSAPITRVCSSRLLISFGKYSYAIYLWHYLVVRVLDKLLTAHLHAPVMYGSQLIAKLIFIGSCVLLSYSVAWLSYHLYERHFLKLKRFFEYDQAPRRTSPAVLESPALQTLSAAASD